MQLDLSLQQVHDALKPSESDATQHLLRLHEACYIVVEACLLHTC